MTKYNKEIAVSASSKTGASFAILLTASAVERITIAVVGKRFLNDKAMGTLTRQALE